MKSPKTLPSTRLITGSTLASCPPKILESYDSSIEGSKLFMLKVCGNLDKVSGAFMLNDIQCKFVNGILVPDIKMKDDNSTFFYNCSFPLLKEGLIFIWNNNNKEWIDASTTTELIKKRSEDRILWVSLTKKLEKKFGFSKTEARKCFRHLKLAGVEELVRFLKFFNENDISEDVIVSLLSSDISVEVNFETFGLECINIKAVKLAIEYYIAK